MFNRVLFLLITAFWLLMNYLLWRAEFNVGNDLGSPVPVAVVWQKMLTAPDDSSLAIIHQGRRIGFCRWAANVGEELAAGKIASEEMPEGMVRRTSGYTVDFDGNTSVNEANTNRLRFSVHGSFSTNHTWREVTVRFGMRPGHWELQSSAAAESVRLKYEEEYGGGWQRDWTFAELRDPRKLIREFGGPFALPMLSGFPIPANSTMSLGLVWDARNDWLKIGRARVRVYRLTAKIVDRYQVVVVVSRVGEILRVELPTGVVLVNDAVFQL